MRSPHDQVIIHHSSFIIRAAESRMSVFAYPIAIAVGVLVVIGIIVLIVWINTDPWEDVE